MMQNFRRFYIVDVEKYFKGIKSYGKITLWKPEDRVAVVDLNDLVMQYTDMQTVMNMPRETFCSYPVSGIRGTFGIRNGASRCSGHKEVKLSLDDAISTVYLSYDKRFVENVLIGITACGLVCHYNRLSALNGSGEVELLLKDSRDCRLELLLVYRVKDSLVLGYEASYGFTEGNNYYFYTFSLSLAYDLRTAQFQGYQIYGGVPRGCVASQGLALPMLAKEIYRWA